MLLVYSTSYPGWVLACLPLLSPRPSLGRGRWLARVYVYSTTKIECYITSMHQAPLHCVPLSVNHPPDPTLRKRSDGSNVPMQSRGIRRTVTQAMISVLRRRQPLCRSTVGDRWLPYGHCRYCRRRVVLFAADQPALVAMGKVVNEVLIWKRWRLATGHSCLFITRTNSRQH